MARFVYFVDGELGDGRNRLVRPVLAEPLDLEVLQRDRGAQHFDINAQMSGGALEDFDLDRLVFGRLEKVQATEAAADDHETAGVVGHGADALEVLEVVAGHDRAGGGIELVQRMGRHFQDDGQSYVGPVVLVGVETLKQMRL